MTETKKKIIKKKRRRIRKGILIFPLAVVIILVAFFTFKVNIYVNGDTAQSLEYESAYMEKGANAEVSRLFGLWKEPLEVVTTGSVDTETPGEYSVTYEAKYMWQEKKEERKITVEEPKDVTAPEITLEGGNELSLYIGNAFTDTYSATDDFDGDVTGNVAIEGGVDTSTTGDYTIKYTVEDAHGNVSEATRTVHILPLPKQEGKVIYLTFDDGPGPYTERLLGILKDNNVNATFFVTGRNPNFNYLIGEASRQGNAIAVHTTTHDYAQIYASEEAYWNDFETMENIIQEQTGSRTNMFRFPGGSSNTVSANYKVGIMTSLAAQASEKGLVYFDWNVSSGDAGNVSTADEVFNNITSAVEKRNFSIVLCHDVKEFTVDAMDRFVKWGKDHGYTFGILNPSVYPCHHGIAN